MTAPTHPFRYFLCSVLALIVGVKLEKVLSKAPGCVDRTLQEIPSPDGKTIAAVRNRFCRGESASAETLTAVTVHPAGDPNNDTMLFGVVTAGVADVRPMVTWSTPTLLNVTVPDRVSPNVLQTRIGSIQMQLRRDPGDVKGRVDAPVVRGAPSVGTSNKGPSF